MASSRLETVHAILRPKLVRIGGALWIVLSAYDMGSNQVGLPKLKELWGMSGSLLPWWGWLLILQGVFVYALFEYVRSIPTGTIQMDAQADDGNWARLKTYLDEALASEERLRNDAIGEVYTAAFAVPRRIYVGQIISALEKGKADLGEAFEFLRVGLAAPIQTLVRDHHRERMRVTANQNISRVRAELEHVITNYTGEAPAWGGHPNYTLNPMKAVPGDEVMPADEMKLEFRRCLEEFNRDTAIVDQVIERAKAEMFRIKNVLVHGGADAKPY